MNDGVESTTSLDVRKEELSAAIEATRREFKNARARMNTAVRTGANEVVCKGFDIHLRALRAMNQNHQTQRTLIANEARIARLEANARRDEASHLRRNNIHVLGARIAEAQLVADALHAEVDLLVAQAAEQADRPDARDAPQ